MGTADVMTTDQAAAAAIAVGMIDPALAAMLSRSVLDTAAAAADIATVVMMTAEETIPVNARTRVGRVTRESESCVGINGDETSVLLLPAASWWVSFLSPLFSLLSSPPTSLPSSTRQQG